MKSAALRMLLTSVVCLVLGTLLFAQNKKDVSKIESQYLISAKAGAINFVSGQVGIAANAGKVSPLEQGEAARVGERILTGGDGKVEILLNPGSFVRIGENSEFSFLDTSLDDLRVKLTAGSAIFEVIASDDFRVAVETPRSNFFLVKSGIYRVDAMPDGTGRIQVWKGKAQIGNQSAAVKGGKAATIVNGETIVEKFDKDDKTELEAWSKQRAKDLAKLNAKLQRRAMNDALISSFSQRGWSIYDSFGLWVRDPVTRSFCFLPFGYGWSSPYGYWLQRDIWSYRLPQVVFYYNPQMRNSPNAVMPAQSVTPPFQTVQPNRGGGNSPQAIPDGAAMPTPRREARPSMPIGNVESPGRGRGGDKLRPIDQ